LNPAHASVSSGSCSSSVAYTARIAWHHSSRC
jgi:hypothetical protein